MPDPTYAPCPNCRDGMDINPYKNTQDNLCPYCHGTRIVAEKCVCGRPANMGESGYVKLGRYICGRKECLEIVLAQLEAKSKYAKDEEDYFRSPWGFIGGCC